jgi:hypothetical protein
MPTNSLLDLRLMACLLLAVDACVLNVWLCVVRHAIHDIEGAGRPLLGSHSVWADSLRALEWTE